MTRAEFAEAVDIFCQMLDASETSGRRTAHRNELVKGVAHSAHLAGLARDVVYDQPRDLTIRLEWARRLGLALIAEGDHDHLQPLQWRAG